MCCTHIPYNFSDNDDEGSTGYGYAPPAIGAQVIYGPRASADGTDNDRDGEVDEKEMEMRRRWRRR